MKHTSRAFTALLLFLLLAGMAILCYPSAADRWNRQHQSRAVAAYTRQVAQLTVADHSRHWEAADAYNLQLAQQGGGLASGEAGQVPYDQLLNIGGDGVMGHLEIPAIQCSLPIGHGTGEAVLRAGVGHMEGSSLPVGGESCHCVIAGHRGLPSAKLLTHLDKLAVGDVFYLHILDKTLAYEVDRILTVLPSQTQALQIEPGQDLCTLLTCTPYAVNTHRLLVRGRRIPDAEPVTDDTSEAPELPPEVEDTPPEAPAVSPAPAPRGSLSAVLPVLALPLAVLVAAAMVVRKRRKGLQEFSGGEKNE